MPCTVSDDTRLFPPGLDFNLGVDALANTHGIQSCFLRKEVPLSLEAAAHFAKQLYAAGVFTVGDFLGRVNHEMAQKLPDASVASLDACLQRFPGLSENRHAAPGTVVSTWLLLRVVGATALAHPTGVVCFCCAYHAVACANVL